MFNTSELLKEPWLRCLNCKSMTNGPSRLPPDGIAEDPNAEKPTEPDDKPRSPENQPGAPPPRS